MARYDYIITGAGAAGLSLLVHMLRSGKFSDKKILLLDKAPKTNNDRTWCFWEKEPGLFEEIVHKRWNKLAFHGNGYDNVSDIFPYNYKLVRGIDFYNYCFGIINSSANVTVKYGHVERCISNGSSTRVIFNGEKIAAEYIFNSILFSTPKADDEYWLLQHFKGWLIKTAEPAFDTGEATLMDFRVPQQYGTTFVYVMPFSETEALVEYTLFSKNLLQDQEYNAGLKAYCSEWLQLEDYEVIEEERGVIPMTNHKFPVRQNNIINIGTAGGQTKASSGYTFRFIQKNSAALVDALVKTGKPFIKGSLASRRFNKYDTTLLNILYNNWMSGAEIFTILMKNNEMRDVLKFLDNETSVVEEIKLMRRLPALTFLRSALT